jgi:putative transcription factor
MDCEVCGKREAVAVAVIDGARLNVCEGCSNFGRVERRVEGYNRNTQNSVNVGGELVLIEGYGRILSAARLGKKLSVTDLSRKLNISEKDLENFESETFKPIEKIAKKLEKELNVKILVEE